MNRKYLRGWAPLVCFLTTLLGGYLCVSAKVPEEAVAKLLPDRLGSFKAVSPVSGVIESSNPPGSSSQVKRTYEGEAGSRYDVEITATATEAEAFALLTDARANSFDADLLKFDDIGIASFQSRTGIFFSQGMSFVVVRLTSGTATEMAALARSFAQTLDAGSGEVPVLVKHLPDWGNASHRARYFVSLMALQQAVRVVDSKQSDGDINKVVSKESSTRPSQPILDALTFDGGAEAVAADYDQSQLVIVEFTTPQLSIENDSRVWTKIADLKSKGQPTPVAYRRVGNYSVFVFNAPDEKTANALGDQVKYEQVVQWLGDDPHLADRLQKYFTQTSAGVLIAVLKSSGLSLLLCLVAGALIGTMMFRHRRTQKAAQYSDAGGSIRLNLDELTGPANTGRLLKSANSSEGHSTNS